MGLNKKFPSQQCERGKKESRVGLSRRLRLRMYSLKLSHKLRGNFLAVDHDQCFIVFGFGAVGKVVGTKDDDALVNDHHLVMHLTIIAVTQHI